jgi:heptosyltransferase-1
MRVLLVKMSSLGDVVHALPAVTDASRHGIEFDWVVEEAFTSIPERHPAVRTVLPIAWRRWRKNLFRERASLGTFVKKLRSERYDLVLDAQGLVKSAAVTALARAPIRAGLSFSSAREGLAALAYNRRIDVFRGDHAVDRLRRLFAAVFEYPVPDLGEPESFGLIGAVEPEPISGSRPRVLFLHGTTWVSKLWPVGMWRSLAQRFAAEGWQVELPWGDESELQSAQAIVQGVEGARVLAPSTLAELGERIATSALVIGVDSGLAHLAGASNVPTVVIYGSTNPDLTGCRGEQAVNLGSDFDCAPCLSRECGYRGEAQRWQDEVVHPACYARITPDRIWEDAMNLLAQHRA